MVNLEIRLSKCLEYDLRRSYAAQQGYRFERALASNQRPSRYNFSRFSTFKDVIDDGCQKLKDIFQELNGEFTEEIPLVELVLKRRAELGWFTTMAMYSSKSSLERAVIFLKGSLFFREFYPFSPFPEGTEQMGGVPKHIFRKTIHHELRHHLDYNFLMGTDLQLRKLNSEKFPDPEWGKSVNHYLFDYLLGLRVEGMAELDENYFNPDESITQENLPKSAEERRRLFLQDLLNQTKTVMAVFSCLSGRDTVGSIYSACWQQETPGVIIKPDFWKPLEIHLPVARNFSIYEQGERMVKIITLAEIKKKKETEKTYNGLDSLFGEDFLPSEIRKKVSRQIFQQKTLGEFFGLFYASTETLGLSEKEIVIPREYTLPFLDLERRYCNG